MTGGFDKRASYFVLYEEPSVLLASFWHDYFF
jgi:hypothetical protein